MKKTTIILLLNLYLIFFGNNLFSQNIGINSSGILPNNSAMLDVDATDKGILIPRMTTAQRNAIVSPAVSLMIFNTTTNCLEIYVNSTWQSIYCGCSGPPAVPGTVSGNITICSGSSNTYFIAPVVGATSYTWTAPVGWTINSGQGTISIGTTSSATSGDVCVASVNACGTSSQSCLTVTVNTIPATPGSITGLTSVTNGQGGVVYSIAAVPGATTYTWSVPSGSTITSGQGTTSITVTFGATSGDVCVTASNTCGTSASSCVAVTVTGCYVPGSQVFSYTGAFQTWTVPCGVTSININAFGARGGNITNGFGSRSGGYGGNATGNLVVTPGQILYVYIGGVGATDLGGVGGYNGGGISSTQYGAGGGGASDVRISPYGLADRVIVAGGGGGCTCGSTPTDGGPGGGLTGGNGISAGGFTGGLGGTQVSGGNDGCCYFLAQGNVTSGFGFGAGPGDYHNAGGGGGWYGGGSGAGHATAAGGSSYLGGVTGGITTPGVQNGNGQVTITW